MGPVGRGGRARWAVTGRFSAFWYTCTPTCPGTTWRSSWLSRARCRPTGGGALTEATSEPVGLSPSTTTT